MKRIEEFFSSCDRTLYHYTSVGALVEIAKSKVFHAGNAYFQNDSEEISHASGVVKNVLRGRESQTKGEELYFLQQFRASLDTVRNSTYGIFVFSLSERGNQLSQWRGYTPHGRGVSLGFSPDFVNGIAKTNKLKLARCLYGKSEQEELASALIEKMIESFRNAKGRAANRAGPTGKEYFSFIEKFRGNLLQVFSIMKHASFSEEREWRLISPYFEKFANSSIEFKDGSLGLTPYLKVKFPRQKNAQKARPFSHVYSGPAADPKLAHSALHEFLVKHELSHETRNSLIPFRKP